MSSESLNQQFEYEINGAYLPRGFAIHLFDNRVDSTEKLVIPDSVLPTFMHEVSHFIQDRWTFRGILDFLNYWDQVSVVSKYCSKQYKFITHPIKQRNGRKTRLPVEDIWTIGLDRIRAVSESNSKWQESETMWAFETSHEHLTNIQFSEGEVGFPCVTFTFRNNLNDERIRRQIGAWEIKEAYAVAVAMLHGGKEKSPSDGFEYLSIERYLSFHFGNVSHRHVIAFCHWALQNLAPAKALVDVVESCMRSLPEENEVFELGRKYFFDNGSMDDLVTVAFDVFPNVISHLESREACDAANIHAWYHKDAVSLVEKISDANSIFPLDTFLANSVSLEMSVEERSEALSKFFEVIQIPMVIGPNGYIFTINTDQSVEEQIFLNRSLLALFSWIWSSEAEELCCPLYNSCVLSIRDEECTKRPWRKNRNSEGTCPFGQAANLIGIRPDVELLYEAFK